MYETFMMTLRKFSGSEMLRDVLIAAGTLLVLTLLCWATPAFREWHRRLRERGGWRGALVGLGAGLFKLAAVLLLARLIIVAMVFQAEQFERHHGRITETNRSAVLMKWGSPHEQRELAVRFTEKRTWVTRQLKLPGEKGRVVKESFWADEEKPVEAVDGLMPAVISTERQVRHVPVKQKAIQSADVDIIVTDSPRQLGGANYAGYDDAWRLKYVVTNAHDKPVTAHMSFPLPATTGLFNKVSIKVNGQEIQSGAEVGENDKAPVAGKSAVSQRSLRSRPAGAAHYYVGTQDDTSSNDNSDEKSGMAEREEPADSGPAEATIPEAAQPQTTDSGDESEGGGALAWRVKMKPGQECTVEIAYQSRGLEYLRYTPRPMVQTGHYRVAMTVNGIASSKLDWPMGSMPPAEKRDDLKGTSYQATWTLDNAMTNYDIGVKLPVAAQPEYYFASLLNEAPIGLVLLLLLLILPRLVMGETVSVGLVTLLAAAYYLFYTFMGNLADLVPGFAAAFAVAVVVLLGIVLVFRCRAAGRKLLVVQDVAWFAALMVLFPLAIIDTDRTGFWMQVFYVAMLLYVCVLVAKFRVGPAMKDGK